MTVEIEHVEEDVRTVTEIVGSPEDVQGEVVESRKLPDDPRTAGDAYEVSYKATMVEEKYVVSTKDTMGKESRTYWIEQNDDGDWEVVKLRKSPNRGHSTVKKHGQLSTKTVREALKEQHGIEVVN